MYNNKNYLLRFPLGFQLFIYLILSLNKEKSYSPLFSIQKTKIPFPKPTTICIMFIFLFVISYHRQHHRFTLCRQCLVCILMSNTHRAEAVIKKPELLFFFLVYGFKRKGHSIKGGKMLSVLHKKKLQKLWLLRCWLYRIFISSRIFCFCFYNKCNDNLHTLLTKTMSFMVSLSLSLFSLTLLC